MKLPLFFVKFLMIFNFFNFFQSEMTPRSKVLNVVIERSVKIIKKKYHINLCMTGSGNDKDMKLEYISLSFQINRRISREEGRCLIIDLSEIILSEINKYDEIKPYLSVNPFSHRNIEIFLFVENPDYSTVYHPELGAISLVEGGKIQYLTYDPDNEYKYKSRTTETYEEALEKVKNCKQVK